MKTDLILCGKHFNMATKARRRRLVVSVYVGLAALVLAGWFLDRWQVWGCCLILSSTTFIYCFVLGGFGALGKGMIKPFLGNEVRARYLRNTESSWSRLSRLTIPKINDEREFCSDEREVRRRDNAHEVAYRRMGVVGIITFLIAYFKNAALPLLERHGITLSTAFFDNLIYGLLIASFILFVTLPQAILLWTEPDMEEPQ
jgi:hypothetical protein